MNRATCNTKFSFDKSPLIDTLLINTSNGIFEGYIQEENHEIMDGYETLEDGRSRRYIVRSGPLHGTMITHDIKDSGMPIKFGYISDKNGLVINRTSYMNSVEYSGGIMDIAFTILHGRNPSWIPFNAKPGASLKMYSDSIESYFKYAKIVVSEMKKWKGDDALRSYVVILCKDHRLRAPHFDYLEAYRRFGSLWNMPKPKAAISDVTSDPQWWETLGFQVSKEVQGDVCVLHYDDHCPAIFSFRVKGREVMPSVLRRRNKSYFIREKWSPNLSFIGYGDESSNVLGDIINDSGTGLSESDIE